MTMAAFTSLFAASAASYCLPTTTPLLRHPPTPRARTPTLNIDLASFTQWGEQVKVENAVKQMMHPDVPVWLVFEGLAQPAEIQGSATTDSLHMQACRLHNLAPDQKLRFVLENGTPLPPGVPISESPLAETENEQVIVQPVAFPVKRGYANPSSSGYGSTRNAIAYTKLRKKKVAVPKTAKLHLICDTHDAGSFHAAYKRKELAERAFKINELCEKEERKHEREEKRHWAD